VGREVASNTLAGANYADPATPRPVWSSTSDYFWACVSFEIHHFIGILLTFFQCNCPMSGG
jgi:hypothetical protein